MSETSARKISVSATESEFNHKSGKRRPSVGDTVARSQTDLGHQPIAHQPYHYMSRGRHADDILNVNVGGKKFTVRRTDLLADPRSRLADWFKPSATRPIATDKGGNIYLDRDAKIFRHILAYLRLKKERFAPSLALPAKPDDLAKLVGECDALNLVEFKELALEMLQKYQRTEEQHYFLGGFTKQIFYAALGFGRVIRQSLRLGERRRLVPFSGWLADVPTVLIYYAYLVEINNFYIDTMGV
ncbi:BTB/POZ domain-containing protein [Ditylenchus destructor]|uniref:BTB/POZ domain-containing protein n=1 Tax=Ditylenchus destructor TaxID=166010 RepID=A0AAD4NGN9_9BILA|nr:BTB/POZ domain-containing protein [Ditylenchus destructor]